MLASRGETTNFNIAPGISSPAFRVAIWALRLAFEVGGAIARRLGGNETVRELLEKPFKK